MAHQGQAVGRHEALHSFNVKQYVIVVGQKVVRVEVCGRVDCVKTHLAEASNLAFIIPSLRASSFVYPIF